MSNKNKILIGTLSILLTCAIVAGISYAYWRLTYTQTGVNKVISSCFSMELANEKNNITLDSAYPISDEKGKALTPYSFTITNTCDLFASYTINLEMLEGTTLDSKYVKTMINSEAITNLNTLETTDPSIEGATESRVLFKGSLGSGDSVDYTLRIWMDSETPPTEDTMNKIFQGKITVTAEVSTYSPVENGFTNLAEALLVNEYQTTSLEVAKNKIASKQEVDFSKTAPIIDWQEAQTTDTSTLMITKAHSSTIGTYGVTENATKIILGTSYTFNSETGLYTLKDTAYYDPEAINYGENNYYICGSSITVNDNDIVSYWDGFGCANMYKINSLISSNDSSMNLSSNTLATKQYNFKVYKMYETELESDKSDKGIYQADDDYGTSYYYRGNVTNNYVYFGGFYWRIIRVNGDGSIRLLYAGTTTNAEGSNLGIEIGRFNGAYTNPTYVGYMYSNTLNTSYEDTISNDNDSLIKTKLDSWYKDNIIDTGFSSYVADSGFCNDRSISSDSPGTGATSNEATHYSSYFRIMSDSPSLYCLNSSNDLFTLAGNTYGNGSLTYPVGLITADELIYAGYALGYLNKMSYAYSSQTYWTLSPIYYRSNVSSAENWVANASGTLDFFKVYYTADTRPVINLKSDTEITQGIGTKNDPFIIK